MTLLNSVFLTRRWEQQWCSELSRCVCIYAFHCLFICECILVYSAEDGRQHPWNGFLPAQVHGCIYLPATCGGDVLAHDTNVADSDRSACLLSLPRCFCILYPLSLVQLHVNCLISTRHDNEHCMWTLKCNPHWCMICHCRAIGFFGIFLCLCYGKEDPR